MDREKNAPNYRRPPSSVIFYLIVKVFNARYWGSLRMLSFRAPLVENSSEYLGRRFAGLWQEELACARRGISKPSLLRILKKEFGSHILWSGVVVFVLNIILRLTQPLLLGQVILYFGTAGTATTRENAIMFATALAASKGLVLLLEHPHNFHAYHIGMRMRIALDALIYTKVLKLNIGSLEENSHGFLLNLMCSDAVKFDLVVSLLHYLWIGPIQTIIVSCLVWHEVGPVGITGIFSFLMIVPLQVGLQELASAYYRRASSKTDARINLMSEIISGIQVIKMFTWESMFRGQANAAHSEEVKELRRLLFVKGAMRSFVHFATSFGVFCICVAHELFLNEPVTAKKVYVVISLFDLLRRSMTIFFPEAINRTKEAMEALKRIEYLLELDETPKRRYRYEKRGEEIIKGSEDDKKDVSSGYNNKNKIGVNEGEDTTKFKNEEHIDESSKSDQISLSLHNVSAKRLQTQIKNTIRNVTLEVQTGMLAAVVGLVGSGKTSLLLTLLGELHVTKGIIALKGKISYASQEPWLIYGTIRENILFNQPYRESHYNEVIHICALRRDLQELPSADHTVISEGGITLSGGQRARINLARALYRDADIYLLDDSFAELDSHVSKRLFNDCIIEYLKNKTVIFVTHNTHFMSQSDKVIIMSNGFIADQGTYENLQSKQHLALYERLQRTKGKGNIPFEISRQYMFLRSTVQAPDFHIEKRKHLTYTSEELTFRQMTIQIYRDYFKAGGNYFALAAVLLICIASQVAKGGCEYWLAHWTNINEREWKLNHNITVTSKVGFSYLSRDTCIVIYVYIMAATILLAFLRSFAFYAFCMKIARTLHSALVNSILHSTMELFYKRSRGSILGTITNDFVIIHEVLPPILIYIIQMVLIGFSVIGIIGYTNYILLIPTFLLLVLSLFSRKLYIGTSREFKKSEGLSYAGLTQFVAASFNGLATIRAFDAQKYCTKIHNSYQDNFANMLFLRIAINEAFLFYLDSMCLSYCIFIIFSYLLTNKEYFGGNVGLVVTQSVIFISVIRWGLLKVTELENEFVAVEEVSEFIATRREHPLISHRGKKPPYNWPSDGRIEFSNLSVTYYMFGPPTLKNINLVIQPGEKIGIVGRTGCGKSTLVRSLFRLNVMEGKILIDDINIMDIGLDDLRKKISIIPQGPVLFSGTLRSNLDPFFEYPDSAIWDALEEVTMKETIRALDSGLYLRLYQGGINLSVGQRQLLCLARAILHNTKILILDEALSNIHPVVEKLILLKLRRSFPDCTVLIVAHRLPTVINCDRILVLADGAVVEFDHPYVLLGETNGAFFRLAKETGDDTFNFLFLSAKREHWHLQLCRQQIGENMFLKKQNYRKMIAKRNATTNVHQ